MCRQLQQKLQPLSKRSSIGRTGRTLANLGHKDHQLHWFPIVSAAAGLELCGDDDDVIYSQCVCHCGMFTVWPLSADCVVRSTATTSNESPGTIHIHTTTISHITHSQVARRIGYCVQFHMWSLRLKYCVYYIVFKQTKKNTVNRCLIIWLYTARPWPSPMTITRSQTNINVGQHSYQEAGLECNDVITITAFGSIFCLWCFLDYRNVCNSIVLELELVIIDYWVFTRIARLFKYDVY